MSGCKQIEELSVLGVRKLKNLEDLNLQECPISVLPYSSVEKVEAGGRLLDSSIDKCMVRLESLKLSRTGITEISFGEGVCPVLESLDLEDCDDLVDVGALPTTLTSLKLTGCCALKKITGLRGLAKLRSLDMSGCKEIEELPRLGVTELNNLEDLNLQECPITVLPFASVEKVQGGRRLLDSSIDKCMVRLKSLKLSMTRITEISFGEGVCPVLESLDLAGCDHLVEVGALPTTLTSLDLKDCCALMKITGLHGLAKLRDLDMAGCYAAAGSGNIDNGRSNH
jgi:Leucine-rich repeat (LRR) protein